MIVSEGVLHSLVLCRKCATPWMILTADGTVHTAVQATVIMTALNIKCAACGSRIKSGLKAKFGSHLKSVSILCSHLRRS